MDLVTILKTYDQSEADLIASRLEAAGILVHVASRASAGAMGSPITVGGFQIQVAADKAEEARALIDDCKQ
jgi:hypothetical protein